MENVGALTFRGLDRVLGSLAEIRYDAEWQDIRASDVGAPHRRERIWIIAYPNANGNGLYDERQVFKDANKDRANKRREPSSLCGERQKSGKGQMANSGCKHGIKRSSERMETNSEKWPHGIVYDKSGSCRYRRVHNWPAEPAVGRLAHGIPNRVDRLKGLGNSIVPQIAKILFELCGANFL